MPRTHLLVTLPDADCAGRVRRLLQSRVPGCEVTGLAHDCHPALCHRQQELDAVQAVLSEAIAVLERSRQAFKSAQLAQVRKDLTRLLNGLSGDGGSRKTLL